VPHRLRPQVGLSSASTGQTGESKLACCRDLSGSTLPSAVRHFRSLTILKQCVTWSIKSSYNSDAAFASFRKRDKCGSACPLLRRTDKGPHSRRAVSYRA